MATPPPRKRFAMVCASNMNRSMEAHALLQKAGYDVHSYGVGQHVKLPGCAPLGRFLQRGYITFKSLQSLSFHP